MPSNPRFPDSERCAICEERFPLDEMIGDNENGGFICSTCFKLLTRGQHPCVLLVHPRSVPPGGSV